MSRPSPSKQRKPRGAARVIEEGLDGDLGPIHQRPDGYYWCTADGHHEFGPFASYELARMDRDRLDEQAPQPGESLDEAEDEIGIGKWIDPETGEPAEGGSPPHLDEDWR
ncbi:MAG TPA: hypothetical protein VFK10_18380 [Burkholderiaceae bacterium]|nr:hypothetical protein [Burkholderiaceae bacterium]